MSVTLSPLAGAGWQFFDNNGVPLAGGLLYTYAAGSSTLLESYTTISGTIAHSNPIVLNSAGRVPSEIWLTTGYGYKFVLQTAENVQIATWDNIPSNAPSPFANDASAISYEQGYLVTAGAFIVGESYLITFLGTTNFVSIGAQSNAVGVYFTATGAGTGTGTALLSRSVANKLGESVSVLDFGAVGDGIAIDTQAFINACTYLQSVGGGTLLIPGGKTYLIENCNLNDFQHINIVGYGATIKGNLNFGYCDYITIQGVYVNNAGKIGYHGISTYATHHLMILNCTFLDVNSYGIALYGAYDFKLIGNSCMTIRRDDPAETSSDGILMIGCWDGTVTNNYVNNFKRIGIVCDVLTEPGGSTYSHDIVIANNIVLYAYGADETNPYSNEYNAGIWAEGTQNITIANNNIKQISGNPGQTMSYFRMIGINYIAAASSGLNGVNATVIITGNIVSVGTIASQIGIGIQYAGGTSYGNVIITDNYVENVNTGISINGTALDVNVSNNTLRNLTYNQNTLQGQLSQFHGGNAGFIQNFVVNNLKCYNVTTVAGTSYDQADFIFFDDLSVAFTINIIKFNNVEGSLHIYNSINVENISIDNSIISVGNQTAGSSPTTFGAKAQTITVSTTRFYAIPGANAVNAFMLTTPNVFMQFVGCNFYDTRLDLNNSGKTIQQFNNCIFTGSCSIFYYPTTNTNVDLQLSNCNISDLPAGAFLTSSANGNYGFLFVNNCVFRRGTGVPDTVYLLKNTNNPVISFLQSNAFKGVTLYDFNAGVTAANNLSF
jgi:hypothetical protein